MSLLDHVIEAVTAELGVSRAQLLSPTRSSQRVATARQVAMCVAYRADKSSNYSSVGRLFDRDRTTVRHAVHKCDDMNDEMRSRINELVNHVRTTAVI